MAYKPRKRKVKKNVPEGRAYINSTLIIQSLHYVI